jgi:hypothetical protein
MSSKSQNGYFLAKGCRESDNNLIVFGEYNLNCTSCIIRKVTARALVTETQNVDFAETCVSGRTGFSVVCNSETHGVLPSTTLSLSL